MSHAIWNAVAYCLVTFPYAVVWHMVLFRPLYERWEYFGSTPQPLLGLGSMVVQGVALSVGFALLPQYHGSLVATMAYAGFAGAFLWSVHVLAAMAKHAECRHIRFLCLETVYLTGQFVAFGLATHLIYTVA